MTDDVQKVTAKIHEVAGKTPRASGVAPTAPPAAAP